jgi:thymidylate synthase ThyX
MFEVKMIEDSISPDGVRLSTMQLKYPRYIHAELMTHRVFSRNASSSRAIPVEKLAEASLAEMVEPIRFGLNQPGMQANEQNIEGDKLHEAKLIWRRMAEFCASGAKELAALGLHKQWANRPTEWFGHISVVVTSTEWDNFFALRAHPDAQPEIQHLAFEMLHCFKNSIPKLLQPGEWHLPYVTKDDRDYVSGMLLECEESETLCKISAARCARVSYLTHNGEEPDIAKDLELYDRLVGSRPIHASPTEHQATPDTGDYLSHSPALWGNLKGWIQHRKLIESSFNS